LIITVKSGIILIVSETTHPQKDKAQAKTSGQVTSRERVADYGEVFTAEREVNAMLGLVRQETERIDSRFLEPACGDGNFLAPILARKIELVATRYRRSQPDFERNAILAVGSVYGVDILLDNVITCRERLFGIFDEKYTALYGSSCRAEVRQGAQYILGRNILHGDALSYKTPGEPAEDIVFSEWSLARGGMVKRRDFRFARLLRSVDVYNPDQPALAVSDTGQTIFLPEPVREYPLTHYLNLSRQ
jgi:hypothetical protein